MATRASRAFMRAAVSLLVAGVLAWSPAGAEDAAEPGWILDARTDCAVWNWNPLPNESMTWSGECRDGRAYGPGVVQWFQHDVPTEAVIGEYRDGRLRGDDEARAGGDAYGAGDYATALRKYRQAAEMGHAAAQNNLAYMYEHGEGVAQDFGQALRWYRMAAQAGSASAQFNLADMYERGRGVAVDAVEAARWYRLAAEQGHPSAQNNLGFLYENGTGVAQDFTQAHAWYTRAAESGNASAQYNLGVMYDDGVGVAEDDVEAVRLYRLAAEQENTAAQNNLGFAYQHGQGVAQDYTEALHWYREAAGGRRSVRPIQSGLHAPERRRRAR